jgi:hypothetical protein
MIKLNLKRLEQLIINQAPSHYATIAAPDTSQELLDWVNSNGIVNTPKSTWNMPVSSEFCEQSIYSAPVINIAFRAWHDSLHILHGVGFDLISELETARLHQIAGIKAKLTDMQLKVLWLDTAGQNLYQNAIGNFPVDQKAFVYFALSVSLNAAIKKGDF